MKILNICMSAPFTENYSYQDNLLTEYQRKMGHDVTIITSQKTRDNQGKIYCTEQCDKILDNGVRLIRIKLNNKFFRFIGFYPQLKRVISECQPDFIFIHGLCSFIPLQAINYKKKHLDCIIVADNHQDLGTTKVEGFPFAFQMFVYRFFWKYWIKYVEKVYGTTSWRRTFAHNYYGIPYEKLDVLIMGIDSDKNPENPDLVRKTVRQELNIPEESFVFVTGGKLDNNKNIIMSMQAFGCLENNKNRFLIFGSVADEIKKEFFEIINKDNRFIYLGYIKSSDVKKYFYASDFGVFPGRHSVLWEEAIGCGLPCVFRRYEDKDHVEVCDNCICLDKVYKNTIYEIIKKVSESEEYYMQLRENARKAVGVFSYRQIAEKSVECYKMTEMRE